MVKLIKLIILETIILIILLGLFLFLPKQKNITEVCFRDRCFKVEVAKTQEQMERGLMFIDNLEKDRGMLFVFSEEGSYPFWMKNTLIPLDIIWINKNKKVIFIKENAQPCTDICDLIEPKQKAKYVLEINGGLAREINARIGEKVTINY